MEILNHKQHHHELLSFLPRIKSALHEWLIIDVRLTADAPHSLNVAEAAALLARPFKDSEGKLYICNEREIIALVHCGPAYAIAEVTQSATKHLPEGSCEVHVSKPTPQGLAKLEILITGNKPGPDDRDKLSFAARRQGRPGTVTLVADDDLYMRLLVKKGAPPRSTIHEVLEGTKVLDAYIEHAPDIVFLDIHLPRKEGTQILRELLALDPLAYVIMLSADSSHENVALAIRDGAKGFLTKPFTKERLLDCFKKYAALS